jgi:hypothetical protein
MAEEGEEKRCGGDSRKERRVKKQKIGEKEFLPFTMKFRCYILFPPCTMQHMVCTDLHKLCLAELGHI